MAVLTRYDFDTINTEVTRHLGNPKNASAAARIQNWIAQSYFEICLTWKHYELDVVDDSKTLADSGFKITLPTDVFILQGIGKLDPGNSNAWDGWIQQQDFQSLQAQSTLHRDKPTNWARFENDIYFDRLGSGAIPLRIFYYKVPVAPDFAAPSSSVLSRLWDDVIIMWSAEKGHRRLWDHNLANEMKKQLEDLLMKIPQPPLIRAEISDRPSRPLIKPRAGAQG